MGRYTGISDISKAIINILKEGCSEENIVSAEGIGACEPGERDNFIVGLHLYSIKESEEIRSIQAIPMTDDSMRNPPTHINISIMISVVSKTQLSIKSLDEQRILGKVIQILADNPTIKKEFLCETLQDSNEIIAITMENVSLDDQVKIWSMFGQPYKLSCFYNVGPITIDSEIVKKASPRIKSVYLDSQRKQVNIQ